jgi:pimeloyl-ACP methyl ester carboxylesterase
MSAEVRVGVDPAPSSGLAAALYFDSGEHRLFGWLHRGSPGVTPDIGLVICKPFGYEAICSHRGQRAFAEAASGLGVPTLRFDYSGTGDSAEIEPHANQLDAWTRDVTAAVAELQRCTGVERVCLLGFRLGALLAILAARQCKAISALVLVAPVISGPSYLRELRTIRLAASLGTELAGSPRAASTDPMEVSGFSLSAATLSALAQVDLKTSALHVSEALVIDGSRLPVSRTWAEKQTEFGIRTNYLALPGLIEMIMTAPQFAVIPQEMIAAVTRWLLQLPFKTSAEPRVGLERNVDFCSTPLATAMSLPVVGPAQHVLLTERPVFFTRETVLFGIVTEPDKSEIRRRAVILLNAGADYHIGASGMYVGFARRWARHGYVVLRMDLGGLGDSGTRSGRADDEVFPPAAIEDIRAAVEWMQHFYGVRDITLAGVCSGAYHALRAAVAAVPVSRILMINPKNFFRKESAGVNDLQVAELVRNPSLYRKQLLSTATWKRLLAGQIDVRYIMKVYLHRTALEVESTFRNWARRFRIRLPRDLGWELEQIGARGVRVVFVFARGEPGIDLLTIQGGSSVKRLGEHCRIHVIDGADHVFSRSAPRAVLEKILSDEIFARTEWSNRDSPSWSQVCEARNNPVSS